MLRWIYNNFNNNLTCTIATKGDTTIKNLHLSERLRLRRRPRAILVAITAIVALGSIFLGATFNNKVSALGNGAAVTGVAGKCLENKDGTVAAGNKIQLGTCDSSTKQVWQWHGDMSMRVQGYCLDVQTSGTTPGTTVQLWPCNGTGAQRWYTQADGTLKNQNSSLCLQTVGSASADGTGVQINTCNASNSAQQWTIPSDAMVKVPLFTGDSHNSLPQFNTVAPTITVIDVVGSAVGVTV